MVENMSKTYLAVSSMHCKLLTILRIHLKYRKKESRFTIDAVPCFYWAVIPIYYMTEDQNNDFQISASGAILVDKYILHIL